MFLAARIPPGTDRRSRILALLLRIRKDLGSNIGLDTNYSEVFHGFPQEKSEVCLNLGHDLFRPYLFQFTNHWSMDV
jgi:hypothetical protein